MNTPICDFVREYAEQNNLRLHMPGHKGKNYIGTEKLDITEIAGADSLYEAEGIIRESEKNAGSLFGAKTFYSTEGSSLCIRAMLYLALLDAKQKGRSAVVFAARNVHKAFVTAAAMLDFEIEWLYGKTKNSYLSCDIDISELENMLEGLEKKPAAVYLTSPDYLGNIADTEAIARVCKRYGVLLLVDNAHGAYLRFLPQSLHPMDLGADMCCASAHKTLPVLTGGAYLHISESADMKVNVKAAMGLFGSTSPSYLILMSLDRANGYIADGYKNKLKEFLPKLETLKERLKEQGFSFLGNEPLKITVDAKAYGYTGKELDDKLAEKNIICEFADPDYVVLMLTPEMSDEELLMLEGVMNSIPKKNPIDKSIPHIPMPEKALSVREAIFSDAEWISVDKCCGRAFASFNASCPPAVPIVVCGELIDKNAVKCFKYYGIENCLVVKRREEQ